MKQRIITGILLILGTSIPLYLGGNILYICLFCVATLCLNEIKNIVLKASPPTPFKFSFPLAMACLVTQFFLFHPSQTFLIYNHFLFKILLVPLLIVPLLEVKNHKLFISRNIFLSSFKTFLISTYAILFIFLIRNLPNGLYSIIFVITLIAASDTFAYFGGKLIGKTKLTSISPKKTVEGSIVGFICCIIIGLLLIYSFNLEALNFILISILIAFLAPLGDLYESLFKRYFQVKDSSNILPGHGGIYDRIDSYCLVLPAIYYLLL